MTTHAPAPRPPKPGTPGRRGRGTPARIPGDRKIYTKPTRTTGRTAFYGDFREFAAVGGRCEALRPEGARHAATDIAEALACYDARRRHLEALRDRAANGGEDETTGLEEPSADQADRPTHLGPLLARHIREKHAAGRRRGTLERMEDAAHVLVRELGNCPLAAITVERVQRYVQDRRRHRRPQTGKLTSTATIRIELSLLTDAFTRAVAYGWAHQNPARLIPDKPHAAPARNVWLTRLEGGALLDVAAEHDALARRDGARTAAWGLDPRAVWQDTERAAKKQGRAVQWEQRRDDAEAILATLLYSGGRIAEVLGLLAGDVDHPAGTLAFRHNRHRRLKREWHERTVELWPPLAAMLRDHIARLGLGPDDPLFPAEPGSDLPVGRIDKVLARCCRRAGLAGRDLSPHALRHTFATALLRTYAPTATGARVQRSAFDVAKALGHGSSALVDKVYGHPSAEECTDTLTYEEHRRHPALQR